MGKHLALLITIFVLIIFIAMSMATYYVSRPETEYFESTESLATWLEEQDIPISPDWDCIDYALDLQQRALSDGYYMNFVVHESDCYNAFFEQFQLAEGTHAFNSTRIGDYIYYVEPINHEISRRAITLN